ncbi:MAG: site-2 protease family protein [Eubacteriales bacterium]|nr:site-2 protease family protein [Eubacteriales bacterium]MDD3350431.1 site-2 protease family protein [Eubacteriales bacterium]
MKRLFANPMILVLLAIMAYQTISSGRYSSPLDWLAETAILLPAIVIAISFHEFAHAIVAYRLGDDTPLAQGRVTINPAAHIDPIGLVALLFIGFGWGRPVMINPTRFKKRRLSELLVGLSGVTMNLLLAILFMGLLKILYQFQWVFMLTEIGVIISDVIMQIVLINLVLLVFNLLPIPPLDGFGVITQIFNLENTRFYREVYDKGFFILMILILFNITGKILSPCVNFLYNLLVSIFF